MTTATRFFRICGLTLGFISLSTLLGCEYDSFLDPSIVGRYENTAIRLPILDRIAVIESDVDDAVEATQIQPSDLMAEPVLYKVGPGDPLTLDIFEMFVPGQPYVIQRVVDERGYITIPLIGSVYVAEMTEAQVRDKIIGLLDPGFLPDAIVSVVADMKRQSTYNVIGGQGASSQFFIPEPNFRLLDAIASAGGIADTVRKIRIVRQVPLKPEVERGLGSPGPEEPGVDQMIPGGTGSDPDLINEILDTKPDTPTQDQGDDDEDLMKLIDDVIEGSNDSDGRSNASVRSSGLTQPMPGKRFPIKIRRAAEPAIDVDDPSHEVGELTLSEWAYLDGKWVRIARSPAADAAETAQKDKAREDEFGTLVTQRVIEVPIEPLMSGLAQYNLVIRPNDIIMIPAPVSGVIHLDGEIQRGGSIGIPANGRITLKRAIASAGGLGPLAIPERVEIHRILSDNQEAIVMLNYRAIVEGAEPDVYLKPDDLIRVGTTWYAAPLAVLRNGLRVTYGFGFLLDRNFGNDVFGAPPVNRFGR